MHGKVRDKERGKNGEVQRVKSGKIVVRRRRTYGKTAERRSNRVSSAAKPFKIAGTMLRQTGGATMLARFARGSAKQRKSAVSNAMPRKIANSAAMLATTARTVATRGSNSAHSNAMPCKIARTGAS